MTSESARTVGAATEAEVLAAIRGVLGTSAAEVGPGDDAAVVRAPDGRVVVTTDTLVHGPDFRLAWTSGFDLGWKSAAVNLADVAAMGARPTALVVALALPDTLPLGFVEDLARGLRAACDELAPGCAVEGGDLTASDTLTVAVTALGSLDALPPVLRSGARVGDVVTVAGVLGSAAAGLALLFGRFRDEAGHPIQISEGALTDAERTLIAAQLRPRPPIALGVAAARAGAHAMMDVSDGLLLDATRLADASGVTVELHRTALGPDPAAVLSAGEDHALLAVFAPDDVPDGFRPIGTILARAEAAVTVDGEAPAARGGWDPYQDWDAERG